MYEAGLVFYGALVASSPALACLRPVQWLNSGVLHQLVSTLVEMRKDLHTQSSVCTS